VTDRRRSMSATTLSRTEQDSTKLTGDVAQWWSVTQSFIAATLEELRELTQEMESLEQEKAAYDEVEYVEPARSVAPPAAPSVDSTSAPAPAASSNNSEQRLADLARRLEEKLQRSKPQKSSARTIPPG